MFFFAQTRCSVLVSGMHPLQHYIDGFGEKQAQQWADDAIAESDFCCPLEVS